MERPYSKFCIFRNGFQRGCSSESGNRDDLSPEFIPLGKESSERFRFRHTEGETPWRFRNSRQKLNCVA